MQKRILVTGGAGFLGCHLCERLVAQGHQVLSVDNYYTGRRENLSGLLGQPLFEAVRHDVTFPLYLEVDEIYNLACPASPVHYQRDPVQTTKTSVLGAINMLGMAKRLGIPILQASTSEIYGDPDVHPQVEDYRGLVSISGPRACYDEGKRCAETLFYDYNRRHGVAIRVARIFNTYGPRMNAEDGRVVSNFIVQALKNEPITLYGDGQQTRAFCFVDDLVDGLMRLMNVTKPLDSAVNLGNPVETTMAEIANLIVSMTGSRSEIVFRPLPQDDPRQRCPDISKAQELLHWTPKVPLQEACGARSPISRTGCRGRAIRCGGWKSRGPADDVGALPSSRAHHGRQRQRHQHGGCPAHGRGLDRPEGAAFHLHHRCPRRDREPVRPSAHGDP